jgi:hypothetical protein
MREPKFASLAPKKTDKPKRDQSRVVILAYSALDLRPEFVGLERELAEKLAQQLRHGFQENDEKVVLVPNSHVEAYKDKHFNWKSQDLHDIGKYFKADYVIYLELQSASFYETGAFNTLYHGRAKVEVSLVDVHQPELPDLYKEKCLCEYPVERPIQSDEMPMDKFRQLFLNDVARHLSWYFTAHPLKEDISE